MQVFTVPASSTRCERSSQLWCEPRDRGRPREKGGEQSRRSPSTRSLGKASLEMRDWSLALRKPRDCRRWCLDRTAGGNRTLCLT